MSSSQVGADSGAGGFTALSRVSSDRMNRIVLWKSTDGTVIGVEVELPGKWDRDHDEFVDSIVMELGMSNLHTMTLQRFLVVSDSRTLVQRYRKALEPRAIHRTWGKDQRGHLKPKGSKKFLSG